MNIQLFKAFKDKINTLNERVLLNAPKIESYVVNDSSNPKEMDEIEASISFDDQPAHLVTSMLMNGNHKPTLDIDMPCVLEKSSSEGKYHLFIDKEMSAENYEKLLKVLVDVGIVQHGVLSHQWNKDKLTAVRLPGVKKPNLTGGATAKPGNYEKDKKSVDVPF